MRIYMSVDMEGISGISCPAYVLKGESLYATGQRLMTEDVNAAVRGAFDGGATEVIVADMHAASGNLLVEQLDPRALLLAGAPHQPRFPFLDGSVDGMFLIGYHAMAGTLMGSLEHTMSSRTWHKYAVNGVPYGEVEIDAALAGEAGVPVCLVTGDDKVCAEALRFLGNIETAAVKQGLGRQSALCLSPEKGRERVYRRARKTVQRLAAGEKMPVFTAPSPVDVAITYKMVPDADAANVFGTKRLDGYTVETHARALSEMYGGLWKDYGVKKVIGLSDDDE